MFCTAAVKLKDGEEYSDVITIKEEYGKKGKTKEVVYRRCTRKSKEKDLCGLHLRKKDVLIFDKSKSIEHFIEPSSWSDSSSDESDDEVQLNNDVFCKDKTPSELEETKDNIDTEESIIKTEIVVSEDEYVPTLNEGEYSDVRFRRTSPTQPRPAGAASCTTAPRSTARRNRALKPTHPTDKPSSASNRVAGRP